MEYKDTILARYTWLTQEFLPPYGRVINRHSAKIRDNGVSIVTSTYRNGQLLYTVSDGRCKRDELLSGFHASHVKLGHTVASPRN